MRLIKVLIRYLFLCKSLIDFNYYTFMKNDVMIVKIPLFILIFIIFTMNWETIINLRKFCGVRGFSNQINSKFSLPTIFLEDFSFFREPS
jgi:ABC-type tungstate transport system substrate-binding protein